jgi:decaprenylphospho-beta-D-ribofuranose 2-oxidase
MKLSGWGRFPVLEAQVYSPRSEPALRELVLREQSLIARGNGRAYGDSAINQTATLQTKHLNHLLAFDPVTGQVVVEAGVLLRDLIEAFLPQGWFPLVTPGTKYVSLGGAIAADVHGKNHHKDGSFRSCVDWIDVMGADGTITRCSRDENAALFDHTLGGMGLTGIILRSALRLRPVESGWIKQTTVTAPNLKAAMDAFEAAQDATYSVAWIDCLAQGNDLGRSLFMLGEHATLSDLPDAKLDRPFDIKVRCKRSVPFDFPALALNQYTVRAFNALYYRSGQQKAGERLVDWDSYFYPLDALLDWNRIYGCKGFAQFQCVLPLAQSEKGLTKLLQAIADAGSASFLAVLKRFGAQDSAFSFPMEGYTLALDFPVNPKTLALLERLDQITLEHSGRFYLAKDSRMRAVTLRSADARVDAFQMARKRKGAAGRFSSAQAERLAL